MHFKIFIYSLSSNYFWFPIMYKTFGVQSISQFLKFFYVSERKEGHTSRYTKGRSNENKNLDALRRKRSLPNRQQWRFHGERATEVRIWRTEERLLWKWAVSSSVNIIIMLMVCKRTLFHFNLLKCSFDYYNYVCKDNF